MGGQVRPSTVGVGKADLFAMRMRVGMGIAAVGVAVEVLVRGRVGGTVLFEEVVGEGAVEGLHWCAPYGMGWTPNSTTSGGLDNPHDMVRLGCTDAIRAM